MSLESPSPATIAGLVSANPTAGDPFSQGDDHIRLIKSVLKYIFPGIGGAGFSSPIVAHEAELNYLVGVTSPIQTQISAASARVPLGIICMWHGAIVNIPTGWYLCDGTNGTPDLTGRFIIGYDPTNYPTPQITGGYSDAPIVSHTHVATSSASVSLATAAATHDHGSINTLGESVQHTHPYTIAGQSSQTAQPAAGGINVGITVANTSVESTTHIHQINVPTGGSHAHDVTGSVVVTTTNATPAGAVSVTNRNLPPYMVLAYIMRAA